MTNTTKMTQKVALAMAINGEPLTAEAKEVLQKMYDSLVKKAESAKGKPRKVSEAQKSAIETVYNAMEVGKAYTTTDIVKMNLFEDIVSTNFVYGKFRSLMNVGLVERSEGEKGKVFFTRTAE